jgi:hypothetical protein
MNTKNFLMSMLILVLLGSVVFAQGNRQASDIYAYPITGGPEWEALFGTEGHDDRAKACEVPADVLAKMSTKGLVYTCLNYPLNHELMMVNSPQRAFRFLISNSNAYQALFLRKDAVEVLLEVFDELSPASFKKYSSIEDEGALERFRQFNALGHLIGQPEFIDQMDVRTRKQLVEKCASRIQSFAEQPEKFGSVSTISYTYPLAVSIAKDNATMRSASPEFTERINNLVETGMIDTEETMTSVMEAANNIVKQ